MSKCSRCRRDDKELTTLWETLRTWMFYKFFPLDIIDLSQEKYTQGFSDGLIKGQSWERETMSKFIDGSIPVPKTNPKDVDKMVTTE